MLESCFLGKEMPHVPAGSSPSWAELKPLDISLETLDISTVHRRVALRHKSRCLRVSHYRYKEFWIPGRDVVTLDTSTVWKANPNKPSVDLKGLNLLSLNQFSSFLMK